MKFTILSNHSSGNGLKFRVAAEPAGITGVWSEPDRDILRPDHSAIRAQLPARYRKAFDRSGRFWYDGDARWNGERATTIPYMHVYDCKFRVIFTLYAIPTI